MQKTIYLFFTLALIAGSTSGCSDRIVGSWRIQNFNTSTPGEQTVVLQNIGTMEFKKNGSGSKNIQYNVLGSTHNDTGSFSWNKPDDSMISLSGDNSEFSKTWIIVENKKKKQVWKSTDGMNKVQVLELVK